MIVPREGIAFKAVSAGPLRVSSPVSVRGERRCGWRSASCSRCGSLLRFKPDAVFATGGYASVPVGVAARLLRRPLVVFLPDVTPGWAVRLLSRLATRDDDDVGARRCSYLPANKTTVVGYPVRDAVLVS